MTTYARHLALGTGAILVLYGARRYFRNWGTTKDECRMRLPGDELVRAPVLRTTEGVWIQRSVADMWPWLVQMGQDRGGLYSEEAVEDSLEIRPRHNASRLHPERQHLERGDVLRLAPEGWLGLSKGVVLSVVEVIEERAVVLHGAPPEMPSDTVVSFHAIPYGDDRCRLLARTRVGLRHPGEVLLAEAASPVVAFTTRGMLRGIQRRAEMVAAAAEPSSSAGSPPALRVAASGSVEHEKDTSHLR
jgi:hypothetical protein